MSTTVTRMRTTLLLLTLATLLVACGEGASGGEAGGASREQVETSTTERAKEAIPLISEALEATRTEATAQWESCMAISWRYAAFASLTAPAGDPAAQLEEVRAALAGAGYDDATQVDGHVTVTRDDTTVDVEPSPARGKGVWVVRVQSSCADYDGDDREQVENDEARPLDGL